MPKDDVIFEVKELEKSFGAKEVLRGLSFDVRKGEILGIVGKSGAGKSTMLRILCGISKRYQGEVSFDGRRLKEGGLSHTIGFSFQPYSFYEDLSLKDNLLYFGRSYGIDNKEVFRRAQELFVLNDLPFEEIDQYPSTFSGGMKKRFDIVCSLIHKPSLLILDEPTAGLDPLRRKHLISIIKRINKNGVTIIVTSHLMDDIEELCDRVLLMDKGKGLKLDSPENIKTGIMEYECITLRSYPGDYEKIIKHLRPFAILDAHEERGKLIIHCPETEIITHFILHLLESEGEDLLNITITEPDLSEIFSLLEDKEEKEIMRENVIKVNDFIQGLIGKRFSHERIRQIMVSHQWPKEVADVLIGKMVHNMEVERR